jgi:O-antigen ligase
MSFVSTDSYLKERLTLKKNLEEIEKRQILNKVSLDIFQEAPVFGVGPDSVRYKRLEGYKKYGYKEAYKYSYNAHNQYLHYLSVNGLFGFLIFCLVLFFMIFLSVKRRQWLLLFGTIQFFLACFTESYLSRNKGIVIFSFLMILFLINNIDVFNRSEKKNFINK